MSHELYYTSVPRGLQPGSRGFCTVAHTQGLAAPLMQKLEALSGYRPIFPPLDERAHLNPVAYSHLLVNVMGTTYHVLSRVCPAGLDYSERTNKFAHHVALDPNEIPGGGPAWTLKQPGFSETSWQGEPRLLPRGRTPPRGEVRPAVATSWKQFTGDAGWAGVLAEATLADPNRPIYIVTDLGVDVLALFAEALALLPPERRWSVTFSTYFATVPPGQPCQWRWVQKDSPEAQNAARQPGNLVLDLTTQLGPAKGGVLVECARTGQPPPRTPAPSQTPSTHMRPPARSAVPPPQAEFVPEMALEEARLSQTRAEPAPIAMQVPTAKVGLDPWETKPRRKKGATPEEPAPAPAWPTFVGAFIGLLIVAGGAYVAYAILTAETKVDDLISTVAITKPETRPEPPPPPPPPVEPSKPPEREEPVEPMPPMKTEQPPPPPPPMKEEPKPMQVEPMRPLRPRDTHVTKSFKLPAKSSQSPYSETVKDCGKVVEMQLVGMDDIADKISKTGSKRLVQSFVDSSSSLIITIEGGGTAPVRLAFFNINGEKLTFKWEPKANFEGEGRAAADLLRDCVLELKNERGEVTYLSLRELQTLPPIAFDTPTVSLEGAGYNITRPLEYRISSKPIQLKDPPERPLTLVYDPNRRPIIKVDLSEVQSKRFAPHKEGFEVAIEKENNPTARAYAGKAANYFYQSFFIASEVDQKGQVAGLVVLTAEPYKNVDSMEELNKRRAAEIESDNRDQEQAERRSRDAKKPEERINIANERAKSKLMFGQRLQEIDANLKRWKDDNTDLKNKVKPVLMIPAATIQMKVGDLSVDVYRVAGPK